MPINTREKNILDNIKRLYLKGAKKSFKELSPF